MARRFFDDRNNRQVPTDECSTFRLAGPIRSMVGRGEIHLDKPNALALARWLGFELARPEVPTVAGPEVPVDGDDLGPFAVNLDPGALRVDSIQRGTPAGSRPPAPRSKSKSKGA